MFLIGFSILFFGWEANGASELFPRKLFCVDSGCSVPFSSGDLVRTHQAADGTIFNKGDQVTIVGKSTDPTNNVLRVRHRDKFVFVDSTFVRELEQSDSTLLKTVTLYEEGYTSKTQNVLPLDTADPTFEEGSSTDDSVDKSSAPEVPVITDNIVSADQNNNVTSVSKQPVASFHSSKETEKNVSVRSNFSTYGRSDSATDVRDPGNLKSSLYASFYNKMCNVNFQSPVTDPSNSATLRYEEPLSLTNAGDQSESKVQPLAKSVNSRIPPSKTYSADGSFSTGGQSAFKSESTLGVKPTSLNASNLTHVERLVGESDSSNHSHLPEPLTDIPHDSNVSASSDFDESDSFRSSSTIQLTNVREFVKTVNIGTIPAANSTYQLDSSVISSVDRDTPDIDGNKILHPRSMINDTDGTTPSKLATPEAPNFSSTPPIFDSFNNTDSQTVDFSDQWSSLNKSEELASNSGLPINGSEDRSNFTNSSTLYIHHGKTNERFRDATKIDDNDLLASSLDQEISPDVYSLNSFETALPPDANSASHFDHMASTNLEVTDSGEDLTEETKESSPVPAYHPPYPEEPDSKINEEDAVRDLGHSDSLRNSDPAFLVTRTSADSEFSAHSVCRSTIPYPDLNHRTSNDIEGQSENVHSSPSSSVTAILIDRNDTVIQVESLPVSIVENKRHWLTFASKHTCNLRYERPDFQFRFGPFLCLTVSTKKSNTYGNYSLASFFDTFLSYFLWSCELISSRIPETFRQSINDVLIQKFSIPVERIVVWFSFVFHVLVIWFFTKMFCLLLLKKLPATSNRPSPIGDWMKLEEHNLLLTHRLMEQEETNNQMADWVALLVQDQHRLRVVNDENLADLNQRLLDSQSDSKDLRKQLFRSEQSNRNLETQISSQKNEIEIIIEKLEHSELEKFEIEQRWQAKLVACEEGQKALEEELCNQVVHYNQIKSMQTEMDKLLHTCKEAENKLSSTEAELHNLNYLFTRLKSFEIAVDQMNAQHDLNIGTSELSYFTDKPSDDEPTDQASHSTAETQETKGLDQSGSSSKEQVLKMKEYLARFLDVGHLRDELEQTESQLKLEESKSLCERELREQLQSRVDSLEQESLDLKGKCNQLQEEKCAVQTKLDILSDYFKERELELQRDLGKHVIVGSESSEALTTARKRNKELEADVKAFRDQVVALRRELAETERISRRQLSELDKRSHENWLAARAVDHQLQALRVENASLRQKLADIGTGSYPVAFPRPPFTLQTSTNHSSSVVHRPTVSPAIISGRGNLDKRSLSGQSLTSGSSHHSVSRPDFASPGFQPPPSGSLGGPLLTSNPPPFPPPAFLHVFPSNHIPFPHGLPPPPPPLSPSAALLHSHVDQSIKRSPNSSSNTSNCDPMAS